MALFWFKFPLGKQMVRKSEEIWATFTFLLDAVPFVFPKPPYRFSRTQHSAWEYSFRTTGEPT
jgi:hypothetical protein